mmetsp:Transcript_19273/g.19552  ORF Transcript_19273/g.19552 Transcript_19273/m.19552 type:complete len:106 (-) Transcript_19273:233-550(-)
MDFINFIRNIDSFNGGEKNGWAGIWLDVLKVVKKLWLVVRKIPIILQKKLRGVFVVTLRKLTLRVKEKKKPHVTAAWKKRGNTRNYNHVFRSSLKFGMVFTISSK